MKLYNVEEFEFSQAYLFYWDKIERCYNFLNNTVETAYRGEDIGGRLMSFLLKVRYHFRNEKSQNKMEIFFYYFRIQSMRADNGP